MTQPPQQPDIWSDPTRPPAEQQQPQAPQPPQGQTPEQPQPTQPLYADPYGAAPTSAPGYADPYGAAPGYAAPGYAVPTGTPQSYPGYPGYPGYGYGAPMPVSPPNNQMALVAMILSLVGLGCGICAPVGAIMGHIARRQIRERGEGGDGMALAGIIVGWIVTALYLLYFGFLIIMMIIAIGSSSSTTY
ncbi:DUF4190 domain-containing protein [Planosporangium mesophilum]|uniref:DUF4190 domain-containing protein n=1 Tax=Planosporangium mesophilum TaxID=689768 RepID=A0A8J3T6T0_9ACTN|nr:DUF4190 domain-containing protein [Planosporangium mesophilum]NJC81059.1 DUF4190 domain-containing protein [Planosporangium mesophilum]GII21298.1 hypothetical protein Pme01_08950 [Planosporangium mesophilum]